MNIPVQSAGKFSTRHIFDENISKVAERLNHALFRPIRAHYSFFPPIRAHLLLTFLQSVLTFCLFSSNQCSLFVNFPGLGLTFCSAFTP